MTLWICFAGAQQSISFIMLLEFQSLGHQKELLGLYTYLHRAQKKPLLLLCFCSFMPWGTTRKTWLLYYFLLEYNKPLFLVCLWSFRGSSPKSGRRDWQPDSLLLGYRKAIDNPQTSCRAKNQQFWTVVPPSMNLFVFNRICEEMHLVWTVTPPAKNWFVSERLFVEEMLILDNCISVTCTYVKCKEPCWQQSYSWDVAAYLQQAIVPRMHAKNKSGPRMWMEG